MKKSQKGFTLVELAIVLTIVGLLIGGILKGQQLISNAKVTSQMAQVKAVEAATTTFSDTYSAVPGDMNTAAARLPATSCGAATCVDGDGNGQVGNLLTAVPTAAFAAAGTGAGENVNFWLHLSGAGLISGVGGVSQSAFGSAQPTGKVGGGLGVARISTTTAPIRDGGLYVLTAATPSTWGSNTAGTGVMTANQAAQIDRKMDDGVNQTGSIVASGLTASCVTAPTTANPGGYDEKVNSKDCNLQIRIQQ